MTTRKLTPAAKRDLATLQAGGTVQFRVGPLRQLVDAGLVTTDGKLTEEAPLDPEERAELNRLRARYARA